MQNNKSETPAVTGTPHNPRMVNNLNPNGNQQYMGGNQQFIPPIP
jgi:hypothetical protein